MEDLNYPKLIKTISSSTKRSFEAYESDGKMIHNVANVGGKIGSIAKLDRYGEYFGIAVELLEEVKPLLTDRFVTKILTMLRDQEYITVMTLLGTTDYDQLRYILHTWFSIATTAYDNSIAFEHKYKQFDNWIRSVTHDPLPSKIKLVEVGYNENTGEPVVPLDWLDREFASGYALHKAMDSLDSRIAKPPVTYAVIYSMVIQKTDAIIYSRKEIRKYTYVMYLDLADGLTTSIERKLRPDDYQYITYGSVVIGFQMKDILEAKPAVPHTKNVGLLVSRLQKAIRRGRYGSRALIETINALHVSPNYNLPEHNFLRVSSAKQLVWRLFIAILEDCRPYKPVAELSLFQLVLLVLITQRIQEYRFTEPVLQLIKQTAILAQFNDTVADTNNFSAEPVADHLKINPKSDYKTALALATEFITMMGGDDQMLRQLYSQDEKFKPFDIPDKLYHKQSVYEDIILSSIDMHVKPHIILYYQACKLGMSTKEIAGYIWDTSSSYNVRSGLPHPPIDPTLRAIQEYFRNDLQVTPAVIPEEAELKRVKITDRDKRTSFLIIFGRKYKYQGKEMIIAGTVAEPLRIKLDNEWVNSADTASLDAMPMQTIDLTELDPPVGTTWTRKKIDIKITNGKPFIDAKEIPFFDASSLLTSNTPVVKSKPDAASTALVNKLLDKSDVSWTDVLHLKQNHSPMVALQAKGDIEILKLTYAKIFNQHIDVVQIGPVDRLGRKMHNAISYQLEGRIWAIFNLLSYFYGATFKPSGALNFRINKQTPGYVLVLKILESMLFRPKRLVPQLQPKVKTVLWDHQTESASKILAAFAAGHHGFADASMVGSGKTLTAIKIATELIAQPNDTYSGILVLLPSSHLIQTWTDELTRHTENFDVIYQQRSSEILPIKTNTIIISTMSTMRDYPLSHTWLLIIIDECLTVQNRNAFWTQEAWVQSLMSKHLVMMSATFFRTRFDKLYYMLQMLQTGLPNERQYLDTILSESIVSQISKAQRHWKSTFNYFTMDAVGKSMYEAVAKSEADIETKFAKLTAVLSDPVVEASVTKQLAKLIKRINKRCLIYAKSMEEAVVWSEHLKIPIYPKKGQHCIVTYTNGTYGLNDLVIYECIVMRPPPADKLPQIKGRLDRPGQKLNDLTIEYFILKDTIEEGLIIRLHIASQFVQNYIMPLAQFYELSVNFQQYVQK